MHQIVDNDESPEGESFAKNSQLGSWWTTTRETSKLDQERKKDEFMVTRIGGMHTIEYMHHEFVMTQRNQYYASSSYLKVMFTSK
jgi:hypothetical protein